MAYSYKYPRPALSVDCVVFGLDEGDLKLMLIKRKLPPFKDDWALPGGFVKINESIDRAARRELAEETGLTKAYLEQLFTFGAVNRDPRERVVTVAYYALVNLSEHTLKAASDASEVAWFRVSKLPSLAFDHKDIIAVALKRLQGKLHYEPIGFELLPRQFTLSQLQHLYETVWERKLDKRNLRKKIMAMGIIVPLGKLQSNVPHRAAQLYRFDAKAYNQLKQEGFYFEI